MGREGRLMHFHENCPECMREQMDSTMQSIGDRIENVRMENQYMFAVIGEKLDGMLVMQSVDLELSEEAKEEREEEKGEPEVTEESKEEIKEEVKEEIKEESSESEEEIKEEEGESKGDVVEVETVAPRKDAADTKSKTRKHRWSK